MNRRSWLGRLTAGFAALFVAPKAPEWTSAMFLNVGGRLIPVPESKREAFMHTFKANRTYTVTKARP